MTIKYADNEKNKLKEINSLLKSWKNEVSTSEIKFRNDGTYYSGEDCFSEDGFFPHYFNQKIKVLFIGREDRVCWNIIKGWTEKFKKEDISDNGFFAVLLYLLYGINHRFIEYWEIPGATDIARKIGKPGKEGLSFSFMELSKYGNENNDSDKCDKKLIEQFLEHSHLEERKFFKEEFSVLDPDIIITLNLWHINKKISDYIDRYVFGNLKFTPIKGGKDANLYCITLNRKKIPVIDMWHFSRRGNIEKLFYNPLIRLIKSDIFRENFPIQLKKINPI